MDLIGKVLAGATLSRQEWLSVISDRASYPDARLRSIASSIRDSIYGRKVFIRGLVEFTSFCRNDCYYCGLRRSNSHAERYRLSAEEILSACINGYSIGLRTFVLQGGEDMYWDDGRLTALVREIREACPDAAITLSVGERSEDSYRKLRQSGADRYLLRHETADAVHYSKLHPLSMSFQNRLECLRTLKRLGFQTGAGMMVGSPFSSEDTLASDMAFLQDLRPEMVGIGPFIPHRDTPFRDEMMGSVSLTLRMLSIVRIALPSALIPSTTALATASSDGQIDGLDAGANVIMPNITPSTERRKYLLYDNKKISEEEAGENIAWIIEKLRMAGYEGSLERGDHVQAIADIPHS